MPEPPDTEHSRTVGLRQLAAMRRLQRARAAIIGIAGLGIGGISVFLSRQEAGPVTLLLIGTLFTLIAMSGRMPSRLKFGDNEAAWDAVQEYVEETLADSNADERATEVERVAKLAAEAPRATEGALRLLAYDVVSIDLIREATARLNGIRVIHAPTDAGHDLVVESPDGHRCVSIVIKARVAIYANHPIHAIRRQLDAAPKPVILVSQSRAGTLTANPERDQMYWLRLSDRSDIPDLTNHLAKLLGVTKSRVETQTTH